MNMVQLQEVRRGLSGLISTSNGLNLDDVQWLMQQGKEQQYKINQHLFTRGEILDGIYLLITGQLGVKVAGTRFIARLGPGTIVGDISYITGSSTSASVLAIEESRVLHIRRSILEAAGTLRVGFSQRLLTSLAVINAKRLEETSLKLNMALIEKDSEAGVLQGPHNEDIRTILAEVDSFTNKLLKLKESDKLSVDDNFLRIVSQMNILLGIKSKLSEYRRTWVASLIQKKFLPFILMSSITKRCYTKPRGYAGDYLSTQMIYDNKPGGVNNIGRFVDKVVMMIPPIVSMRNRRQILTQQITEAFSNERGIRFTSFASGPAAEVIDAWECLGQPNNFYASLIDLDQHAIEFVTRQLAGTKLLHQTQLYQENLVSLVLGRRKLDLPPQDLIYCVGLIDYFNDEFVVKLLNVAHQMLRPNGTVIFGNVHVSNSGRAFMDHVLEWRLTHRNEADLNRLMVSSSFASPCETILFDDTGVDMLGICRKPVVSSL